MIIKINNKYNRAFNALGEEVTNFDEDKVDKIEFRLTDGSTLEVPSEKLKTIDGGYLKTTYDGVDYIFDDNNRFESVLLGYLIYQDYDTKIITDKDFGVEMRNSLWDEIVSKCNFYTNLKLINKDDTDYIVSIDKINTIVSKNQQRKEENKKVFPFIKSMDKYCTFYVSIFSKSRDEVKTKVGSSAIIEDILKALGDQWKFTSKDYSRIPLHI